MAYNKGLNPVTGRGGQTIDALKSKVIEFEPSINAISDILNGKFNVVQTVISDVETSINLNVPSTAHVFIIDLQCESGSINTSVTVRFRIRTGYKDVTRLNSAVSTLQSSHSFAVIYCVDDGPIVSITKSGTPIFLGTVNGSIISDIKNFEFSQIGIVVDAVNASLPAGTIMKVYYR